MDIIMPIEECNSQVTKENVINNDKNLLEVPTIDITPDKKSSQD